MQPITQLLHRWREGDAEAEAQLFEAAQSELRKIIRGKLQNESDRRALQTTELFNELYLRLHQDARNVTWQDRKHFFRFAARYLRRILVEAARRRNADKRGGSQRDLSFDEVSRIVINLGDERQTELLVVEEALKELETISSRQAQVVELLYFVGLSQGEAAEVLDISIPTIKRDWQAAKRFLFNHLNQSQDRR